MKTEQHEESSYSKRLQRRRTMANQVGKDGFYTCTAKNEKGIIATRKQPKASIAFIDA
jgi:hypothetical protein